MITKEDIQKYKSFKALVQRARIEVQGEAVIMAANLMQWFNELETKLVACEKKFSVENDLILIKEKESPIKQEIKGKK